VSYGKLTRVDQVREWKQRRRRAAHRRQVSEREGGVRRCLRKDDLGVGLNVLLDVLHISEVNEIKGHAHIGEHCAARAIRAPVRAVRDDAMVPGLHHPGYDCDGGSHTRAEAAAYV